jgi:rubrerythrin
MNEQISHLTSYIEALKKISSEAQIRENFLNLLRKTLIKEDNFEWRTVEQSVHQKGLFVGRIDLSVGRVVFEFKRSLKDKKKRREGIQQLKTYLSSDEFKDAPFGILTDGKTFEVYKLEKGNLNQVESFSLPDLEHLPDLSEEEVKALKKFLYKLDAYLLGNLKVPLTSSTLVRFLGYNSQVFVKVYSALREAYERVKDLKEVSLKFNQWKRYMELVYGKNLKDELFFRHTYLSVLIKILSGQLLEVPYDSIWKLLSGEVFERFGIKNYIDKDFFGWIFEKEIKDNLDELFEEIDHLLEFKFEMGNLSEELEEDLLKELYQNIVTRGEREILGEYYTPDWLVERILGEVLKDKDIRTLKVLDPACGSGSFLFFAIKRKREENVPLREILSSVVGLDINPLAVLIARTNYLLALGKEFLKNRHEEIFLPVYTADALRVYVSKHTDLYGSKISVELNGFKVEIPIPPKSSDREQDLKITDLYIERIVEWAKEQVPKTEERFVEDFWRWLERNYPEDEKIISPYFAGYSRSFERQILELVRKKGDDIWTFVLKNIYKPLFLKEKFDLIVGNPPWLVYNSMHKGLQKFFEEFLKAYRIKYGGHLKTHLELATAFLVLTAGFYLKPEGEIAFVMPHSLLNGDQNSWFRKSYHSLMAQERNFPTLSLDILKIFDLKEVSPLFNVPSVVIFAKKKNEGFKKEIPATVFKGKLPKRNARFGEAQKYLTEIEKTLYFVETGRVNYWVYDPQRLGVSPYKNHFREGATIVPRSFWFVEIEKSPYGFSEKSIPIRSKKLGDEKVEFELRGNVPKRFFFKTLLSKRLYPFGFTEFDLVVLPLKITSKEEEELKKLKEEIDTVYRWWREYKATGKDYEDLFAKTVNLASSITEFVQNTEYTEKSKKELLDYLLRFKELLTDEDTYFFSNPDLPSYYWWESKKADFSKPYEVLKHVKSATKPEKFYKLLDYYEFRDKVFKGECPNCGYIWEGKSEKVFKCPNCGFEVNLSSAGDILRKWVNLSREVPKPFKDWLLEAQELWEKHRGEKADKDNIIDWLNYRNKLTNQPVEGGYAVVYTKSGSEIACTWLKKEAKFVLEHSTMYGVFKSEEEAIYLTCFLNSQSLSKAIEQLQTTGLKGKRNIHKLALSVPIPPYDRADPLHQKLVTLGKKAREKAMHPVIRNWLKGFHPNRIRTLGRWVVENELKEIDKLVAQLLELEVNLAFPKKDFRFFKTEKEAKKWIKENKGRIDNEKVYPAKVLAVKYEIPFSKIEEFEVGVEFESV